MANEIIKTEERDAGTLLDQNDITRALKRIAHEIVERNRGVENVVLIGIPTRGLPLAGRIADNLEAIEGHRVLVGALDISLYRDDYNLRSSAPQPTKIAFDIAGKTVVLVDDVLFTGRTIRADFVGKNAPTSREEQVRVLVSELDGEDIVRLEKIEPPRHQDHQE